MPTYEYKCDDCGHVFDEFQGINDNPLTNCTKCNGSVHRVINGGAGLIFKGTGFYITDYKNAKPAGGNGKTKFDPTDSAKSADSKTETKSPEKTDKPASDE